MRACFMTSRLACLAVALLGGLLGLASAAQAQEATPQQATQQVPWPWTTSQLLYDASEPALQSWQVLDVVADGQDRLAVLTQAGVSVFALEEGRRWGLLAQVAVDAPQAMAWAHGRLLVAAQGELVVLDRQGKTRHRIKDIATQPNHHVLMAALPDTPQALVVSGWRTYRLNLASGQAARVAGHLKNQRGQALFASATGQTLTATSDGLQVWDKAHGKLTPWLDDQDQPVTFGADINGLTPHPTQPMVYVGTHGKGLVVVNLATRQVHRLLPGQVPGWDKAAHVWRVAVDAKRDTLYLPQWETVRVLHPASTPTDMKQVHELGTTSPQPIHSNRAVGPKGGAVHLPATDHLLFGTKWGVSVLGSADSPAPFVADERLAQYRFDNAAIQGQGELYDMLRAQKIRGVWCSASVPLTEHVLDLYQQAGINVALYQVFYINHHEFFPDNGLGDQRLARIARQADARGIKMLLAARPFGTSAMNHSGVKDYDYRPMVMRNGQVGKYLGKMRLDAWTRVEFPCPLDRGYWERSIFAHFEQMARQSLDMPIAGMVYELGDAYSGTNIRMSQHEACVCDHCWGGFLATQSAELRDAVGQVQAENWQRYRALSSRDLWPAYEQWLRGQLAGLAREALAKARQINPQFTAHVCLPETATDYDTVWLYNGLIDGFGDADHPTLVFSQQTYGAPFTPPMAIYPGQRMAGKGQHALFVPGLASIWYPPAELARQTQLLQRAAIGTWYYEGHSWEQGDDSQHYKPLIKSLETPFTVMDYVRTLSQWPTGVAAAGQE